MPIPMARTISGKGVLTISVLTDILRSFYRGFQVAIGRSGAARSGLAGLQRGLATGFFGFDEALDPILKRGR